MKRSVNFNGFQPHHRHISAQDLIATYRALGMSDVEILAEMRKQSVAKSAQRRFESGTMFLVIDGEKFRCLVPGCGQRIFQELEIKGEKIYACMHCREWYRPHKDSSVELVPIVPEKQVSPLPDEH